MKNLPLICLGLLLSVLLIHTVANPDIWYHLTLGQKILRTGAFQPAEVISLVAPTFVNFYWFFQVITVLVMKAFGLAGLTLLFWALWAGIFIFWTRLIRLKSSDGPTLALTFLAVIICQVRFQERPEVFSYLFLTLSLYFLSRWQKPYRLKEILWKLSPLQLLWCNSHGYFILGPALMGIKILSISMDERDWKKLPARLSGPAVLLLISMISPFGWRNIKAVFDQWTYSPTAARWITELQPTASFGLSQWVLIVFWASWIFTALATLFALSGIRKNFFALALSVGGLYLSASSARYLPLLVLLSAPLLATLKFSRPGYGLLKPAVVAGSLVLTAWTCSGGYYRSLSQPYKFGVGISEAIFPVKLQQYLKEKNIPPSSRWFCDGTAGSFLEYGRPTVHFYGDSRYMSSESLEYFKATEDPAEFNKINMRENFDYAVLDLARSLPVVISLFKDGGWRPVYGDLTTVVFENSHEDHREKLFLDKSFNIYQGEDLSDLPLGNSAIQWVMALTQTGQSEELLKTLDQLEGAAAIPSPVLDISLLYLKARPNPELLSRIFSLRPKMLALNNGAAAEVDQKLESIRAGTFWNN